MTAVNSRDPHDHQFVELYRKIAERALSNIEGEDFQQKLEGFMGLLEFV